MKTLLSVLFFLTGIAFASGMPSLDVTVSDASNKVAFKGKTAANGTFATATLPPGDYVVQFNSRSGAPAGNYALVISAGKQKIVAEAVPGTKFTKGGVAMRIKVGKNLNIAGQVSSGKAGTAVAASGNAKVKIVDGKRFVWVTGGTGSNLGGHWVEEGSPEARNMTRMSAEGVQAMQDRGSQGGSPGN